MSFTAVRQSAFALALLLSAIPAVAGPDDDRSVLQVCLESAQRAPGAGRRVSPPRELEGSWTVRTVAVEGRPRSDPELDGATFTFLEGRLTIAGRNGTVESYSLQAESGPPLALRLEPVFQSGAKGGWMLAFPEADRLTLAFGDDLEGRPSDFSPARKKVVLTLERRRRPGSRS